MAAFSAKVDNFVRASQQRLDAVFKESVSRTIGMAQTPVAKGGKMRVDTGFLRNSGRLSFSGMPSGESQRPAGYAGAAEDPLNSIEIDLASVTGDVTLWFGWTANYARPREYRDSFLRSAVQAWPQTVAAVARELRQRVK